MSDSNRQDIEVFYEVALSLTKAAGKIILENIKLVNKTIQTKSSPIDFVTETDEKIERFLIESISKEFPDHKFIGEESVASGKKCDLTDDPTWIIDPIDGTTNFIHGFPYACVSIGLFILKVPVIGIIYNPSLDQIFTAKRGQGAFLNGSPMKVSGTKALADALVISEYVGPRDPERGRVILENSKFLLTNVHGIRNTGSAALDLAMIASGAADAFFAYGIHIWDVAAGELLVTEAGGVMVDPCGGKVDRLSRRFLAASSQELAESLAKNLTQYFPEERD